MWACRCWISYIPKQAACCLTTEASLVLGSSAFSHGILTVLTYVCAWRAEQEMVERERAFLAARDNHRGIHNRLRELRGELDGVSSKYEREAAAANSALEAARKLE